MTQYNTLNVRLSNLQFSKVKLGKKEVVSKDNFKSFIKCHW